LPTELEYKTMISLEIVNDFDHLTLLEISKNYYDIKQGYLDSGDGMTTRIRCIDNQKWILTFKQKVGDRIIEIEQELDDRDGQDLWSICVRKLKKNRYVIEDNGIKWELDFFKNGNNIYFVLLEVELPEGSSRPKTVPDFIKEYVLYEVPLTDSQFSNRLLSEVDFATEIHKQYFFKKHKIKYLTET